MARVISREDPPMRPHSSDFLAEGASEPIDIDGSVYRWSFSLRATAVYLVLQRKFGSVWIRAGGFDFSATLDGMPRILSELERVVPALSGTLKSLRGVLKTYKSE